MSSSSTSFELSDWSELVHSGDILEKIRTYPSIRRIIGEFKNCKEAEEVKNIYLDFILSGDTTIRLDYCDPKTTFLANLGLLIPHSIDGTILEGTFTTTCRILQD